MKAFNCQEMSDSNVRECKFGVKCTKQGCWFKHPVANTPNASKAPNTLDAAKVSKSIRECKFGSKCMNSACWFRHSEQEQKTTVQSDEPIEVSEYLDSNMINAYSEKLTSNILFGWCNAQSVLAYYIKDNSEIGTFATWDDAYDAFLKTFEPLSPSADDIGIDAFLDFNFLEDEQDAYEEC